MKLSLSKICGIYKITSPTGRTYIGQSKDIEERKKSYINVNKKTKGQIKLYNSLKKHGWEAHTFEIIEECEFEQLNIRERYWQDFYDVTGKKGLNCLLTSTCTLPLEFCEETRKKISDGQRGELNHMWGRKGKDNPLYGRKLTEEVIQKFKEKVVSEETREKIRQALTGKTRPYIQGEKHPMFGLKGDKNPSFGKKWSEEEKNNHGTSKLVLNTETGIFYRSVTEACESCNIKSNTLYSKLGGSRPNNTNLIYC